MNTFLKHFVVSVEIAKECSTTEDIAAQICREAQSKPGKPLNITLSTMIMFRVEL